AYLEKIYSGKYVSGKPRYNNETVIRFKKTVLMLRLADNISGIRKLKGLNFESLKGDFKGFYSVRVDLKYRLILSLEKGNLVVEDVLIIEDLTNHYK
ncbi:MAG: type II toxin-antitoxin system RelE/ParE family toxin, partial [Chitinophagaceae bacterium]|nr:type II toxin-antitoxin system RelE/ParE family toxin [Chitinophagaceae bacterium]